MLEIEFISRGLCSPPNHGLSLELQSGDIFVYQQLYCDEKDKFLEMHHERASEGLGWESKMLIAKKKKLIALT